MSGVNENPTCVYSATLSLPEVCGVSMVVGQEAVSVSPTALPPTLTSSSTATVTASGSTTLTSTTTGTPTGSMTTTATPTSSTTITGTPLFQITAWPTTSTTQTLTATATPLYMITAWPSPSPVNVSATSTPLYYYTAYPSVGSNASGLFGSLGALAASSSPTAMILGSVALGVVALGAVGGLIAYMRNGGTVGGLLSKVQANKGAMTQFANALPISAEQKAKLTGAIADPSSLLPPEAMARADELRAQAASLNHTVLAALPPQLSSVIEAKQAEVQATVEKKKEELLAFAPVSVAATATATATANANATAAASESMQITIDPENLEAFQTFLALKNAANKSIE